MPRVHDRYLAELEPARLHHPGHHGSAGARVGNNIGFFTSLSSTISALSIANGTTFALRWSDANASGADDGLAIDDFSLTASADTTPPTLSATSPTDGETGVTANASIVLTFSETVQAGSGNITITDGGSDVRTIAITDPQVTISGATVTINPTADLNPGTAYDVIIPSGVITDAAGNPFAGIVQDALDFTIAAAATVSIADAGIAEGDSGTTVLTFTVSRSDNTGDFTVDYTTADVTAAAGDDYVAVTGAPNTIHFTAGGTLTQQISITINGDTTAEPNEFFTVDLGNLVNTTGTAIISDGSATGTIINEDPAPLVINEIDADQTGADTGEFIELFGGANASLGGYVVVLYNGSNDQSYAAFDLDGFSLDGNGYFVLGNSGVANVDLIFANNSLQNGADAVAVYLGNASDFPSGTAVTAANLVDAVVYENNHPDDRGLIDVLTPGQAQVNESERGAGVTQSLQRVTDGAGGQLNTTAFTQAASTPGAANVLPATAAASGTVTHLIHDVQGAFAASPLSTGTVVTIEGIVVGDFQSGDSEVGRSLNGFYLEEETGNWDPDPLTSEGIFIFGGNTGVHEGDLVRVTGTVSEFFGMTEVSVTGVTVVTAGAMPDLTPCGSTSTCRPRPRRSIRTTSISRISKPMRACTSAFPKRSRSPSSSNSTASTRSSCRRMGSSRPTPTSSSRALRAIPPICSRSALAPSRMTTARTHRTNRSITSAASIPTTTASAPRRRSRANLATPRRTRSGWATRSAI